MKHLRYFDKGTMAVIGRRAAIADILGKVQLTRGTAWLAWLFVHIMGLIGPRNRLTTLAGIITRYGFPFHRKQIPIVGDVPTIRPSREDRESTGRGEPNEERDEPTAKPAAG